MLQFRMNADTIRAEFHHMEIDMRQFGRQVLKKMSNETTELLRERVAPHSKTGETIQNIDDYMGNHQWERVIEIPDGGTGLDKGSRPHWIPWSVAQEMAHYYGMTPARFQRKIKKWGTKAFPFIDETLIEIKNRLPDIIDETVGESEMNKWFR